MAFGLDDITAFLSNNGNWLAPLASAGGAIIGGALQGNAVSDATGQAVRAQDTALQTARSDVAPWVGAGSAALNPLLALSGASGPGAQAGAFAGYETSPGFEWQLGQGLRAVDAGAAAKGMLRSGATLKAEQAFGTGLADQDFQNYYARLLGLAQMGGNAATGSANNTIATGQGTAQTLASGATAGANITGNTIGGVTGAINGAMNYDLLSKALATRQNPLMNLNPNGSTTSGQPGYAPLPANSWAGVQQ